MGLMKRLVWSLLALRLRRLTVHPRLGLSLGIGKPVFGTPVTHQVAQFAYR
jgi:hypothetical protein